MADTDNKDKTGDSHDDRKFGEEPGTVKGATAKYPSSDKDTPHAQRDGYIWNDETGWNPPKD